MTCKTTTTYWRDALYNAVRAADGGVEAAAQFLTNRRDTSIHPESLRRKLLGGDQLDVDVAVLLAEFVRNDTGDQHKSNDWLLSLDAHEGIFVDDVPPEPAGGWENEANALQDKFLALATEMGKIAAVTAQTTADSQIDQDEADALVPLLRATRVLLHRMERNVRRAASK